MNSDTQLDTKTMSSVEEAIVNIVGGYIPISLTRAILSSSNDNCDKAYNTIYQDNKVEPKIIVNVLDITDVEDSYRTTGSSYISNNNSIRTARIKISDPDAYSKEIYVKEDAETVMKMIEEARKKVADQIVEYKNKIVSTPSNLI